MTLDKFKLSHRKYDKPTPMAVAEAIREASIGNQGCVIKRPLVELLCDYFEHDLSNFNRQAFIEACGE